ncbi:MAG: hypothetical protein QNJ33_17080 [Crocosphaera sp.]|nr:hypothetical protein [Crocosphaera sp.]
MNNIDQWIENNGVKVIIFVALVLLTYLIINEISTNNNSLDLSDIVNSIIEVLFGTVAVMSGLFTILIVFFTEVSKWGDLAGIRTYVAIGAIIEFITSLLYILDNLNIIETL